MAGWSMVADGSALVCAKNKTPLKQLKPNGFLVDLEPHYNTLRHRFDQFLGSFFEEIRAHNCFWPFPPMLGDGNPIDLFKLFFLVRENGGYEVVTENGLWGSVAQECGPDFNLASAVKLVYVKYLDALERWLESVLKDKKSKSNSTPSGLDLDAFLMGLEAEFKGSLLDIPSSKKKTKEEVLRLGPRPELSFSDDKNLDRSNEDAVAESKGGNESVVNASESVVFNDDEVKSPPVELDGGKKCSESDDDVMILPSCPWEEISSRKRKRKSPLGILNWVTEVAKNPCEPVVGSLPDKTKWKSYGNEEPWKQILLYRETLFLNMPADSSAGQSFLQKNQKPCMYDDRVGSSYNLRDRINCTKIPHSGKTTFQPLIRSSSNTESDSDETLDLYLKKMGRFFDDPSTIYSEDDDVPLGRKYQAEVPEWTGEVIPSDHKWLGTQIWPQERLGCKNLIEKGPIGKGRQDSCGCLLPGSVECVRLHTAEERTRMKLELGSAFRRWKFGKIGERVKRSWTPEEERKFKDTKELNPASFWEEIFKVLPTKSRKKLVRYYFNVYLVERRAYQNRHTPSQIESEDEESDKSSESGSVTNPLMYKVKKSPKSLLKSPNKLHKKL